MSDRNVLSPARVGLGWATFAAQARKITGRSDVVVRKSRAVTLGLVPIVASWFAGCGSGSARPAEAPEPTHQQVCVDQNQRVLEDDDCREPARAARSGVSPFWLFMPYLAGGYPPGAALSGGSLTRPQGPGVTVAEGRVVRGVFGSSARSSAS